MSSTPESPQPQATHTITQTTTEQVATVVYRTAEFTSICAGPTERLRRQSLSPAWLLASSPSPLRNGAGSREIRRPCMIVSMRWKTGKDR